ncbi:MAG: methyltransferase domain-containing protein [Candidatus Omnitrophica bacterium]|nr:methyltransferase domain-containing protein [Candidatus Omnitrophota bacterium]MCM8827319.1 methyltransferase domain-containing protein [Candidatus Omnitrophota bacterium]
MNIPNTKRWLKEFVFEQKCLPWRVRVGALKIMGGLFYGKELCNFQRIDFSNGQKFQDYINFWETTKLFRDYSLSESAILELRGYFGYEREEVLYLLERSQKLLAEEWNKYFANYRKLSEETINKFYNTTQMEIFELMYWHYFKIKDGPLQYTFALDIAQRYGFKNYLDYGSGIGTGGILFALNNFNVSLADVSSTNLEFCKYRFYKRNLKAQLIHLLTSQKQLKGKEYEIITCFDVLEHVMDPLYVLNILKNVLRDNGILIINMPFFNDDKRPMHIVKDCLIRNKIRSIGYSFDWHLMVEARRNIRRPLFVLKKKNRNLFMNKLCFLCDNMFLSLKLSSLNYVT